MKPNSYEIKVVKRCPKCNWRIFDKVTPTSGIIELKCPNCRKIVEIDLSYRTPIRRRATYYRASCHTYTYPKTQGDFLQNNYPKYLSAYKPHSVF